MAALCQNIHRVFRCATQINRHHIIDITSRIHHPMQRQWINALQFSTSKTHALKHIHVKTEGNITEIKGEYVEDPDKEKVLSLDAPHEKVCPLCPHRLDMDIKYTDVLVLSQFLRPDGCLLPRRVTGCCVKAQRKLEKLVHQAQRAGLMPDFRPDLSNGKERSSLSSTYKWRKYNIFYED